MGNIYQTHETNDGAVIFIVFTIISCTIVILIFSLLCIRRMKTRKIPGKIIYGPSVTVTTTTQQSHLGPSPQVVPPYPIEVGHPTPGRNVAVPGYSYQPPYPTHTPNMPLPQGQTPYTAPYPPAGPTPYPPSTNDYGSNPPPYDVAVSQPPVQPPIKEGYGKQAPYNPSYN